MRVYVQILYLSLHTLYLLHIHAKSQWTFCNLSHIVICGLVLCPLCVVLTVYLSRLGCTAAVLRIDKFHEFLEIPPEVRQGLSFASHKPFGKVIKEGFMFRHPRFVRRGGGKRWIKITKEERGGSIICYKDKDNKNSIISSLKIGAATEMNTLKQVPNALVVKSGKRQWVLQAVSGRAYQLWHTKLIDILKQFGNVNVGDMEEELPPALEETKEAESDGGKSTRKSTLSLSPRASKLRDRLTPRTPKQKAEHDAHTAKLIRENQGLER